MLYWVGLIASFRCTVSLFQIKIVSLSLVCPSMGRVFWLLLFCALTFLEFYCFHHWLLVFPLKQNKNKICTLPWGLHPKKIIVSQNLMRLFEETDTLRTKKKHAVRAKNICYFSWLLWSIYGILATCPNTSIIPEFHHNTVKLNGPLVSLRI